MAHLAPMPASELREWLAAGDGLPRADEAEGLDARVLVVDGVPVGGVLTGLDDVGGDRAPTRRRCAVRALQTTLPDDALEHWRAVVVALEDHARAGGADVVTTAVAPSLVPVFQALGYGTTVTSHRKRLDTPPQLQEDRRVAVRAMTDDERAAFVDDVRGLLAAGMVRSGLGLAPGDLPIELEARVAALGDHPPPDDELLVTGTVEGVAVGRLWATLVERDGARDFLGHVIELFPEYRGRRLTPSFVGAMARYVREIGVRDVHLRVYGHDAGARRTYVGAGVAVADVHLRKDL